VTALDLPDNGSYRRYADIHRPAVVWNVAAAPVDSLTLKRWCFVFVGCVGYRGYFDQAAAQALGEAARAGRAGGDGVRRAHVFDAGLAERAGGDPLLSTVIHDSDAALARIVFHELAHQKLYVAGDTAFNESYATAVAPGRGALAGAARRRRGPARRRRWRSSTSGTFASSRTPHAPS
jgi:predicted aminopeptidase